MTTRGCREEDFERIGHWIATVLKNPEDAKLINRVHGEVSDLTARLPLY